MQFSFDNILVINQFVVQTKLELLAAGCLCKANDELYLWGNISSWACKYYWDSNGQTVIHIYMMYTHSGTKCEGSVQADVGHRKEVKELEKKEEKIRENRASSRLIGMSSELNGTQTQLGPYSWCRVQVNKKSSHILASWVAAIQRDLQTSVCPAQSTISQQRCTILESALHTSPRSAFFFFIPLSLCAVHAKINCLGVDESTFVSQRMLHMGVFVVG